MAPLIALLKGWNWPFIVLLDGDNAGENAKTRYNRDFRLISNVFTLADVSDDLSTIESLLCRADLEIIAHYSKVSTEKVNKRRIYKYFNEQMSMGVVPPLAASENAQLHALISGLGACLLSSQTPSAKEPYKA
ncbi:MAG: hypothetical protein H7267_07145 [Sandarakinorhabdus sp.]|nr:hypothetical protein [Sandarakinorhabdus sp.]